MTEWILARRGKEIAALARACTADNGLNVTRLERGFMGFKSWLFRQGISRGKPIVELSEPVRDFYEQRLAFWREVYGGEPPWRYVKKGGISGGMRRTASFNGAKAICAELANLCFSEQADFSAEGESGSFLHNALDESGFWSRFPLFLEQVFALGGGVVKAAWRNGKVALDFVSADNFFPTEFEDGKIKGGVFLSEIIRDKKRYVLAEKHGFEGKSYVVENRLFSCGENGFDGVEIKLSELYPSLAEKTVVSGLSKPLFIYFCPNAANNLDGVGLGVSVFANAIDTLKGIDIVFDSLQREFVLGKKRIIVPTTAIRGEYDADGNKRHYFDTTDEVYQAMTADDKEELKIFDNSTELRVDEHIKAIEKLLDLLCAQVGLSAGALSYNSGIVRTATEVISQNSKSHRTRSAHQKLIAEGLAEVGENIILLGKAAGEIAQSAADKVYIRFDDSIITDMNSEADRVVKLYSAGIISREYAAKRLGIVEESNGE